MNYKRAIGIGILVYLVTMVVGIIVCSILGIQPDITKPIPMEMWITSAVLAVGLSIGGARWYFMGKNTKPSLKAGVQFGAMMIVVGFVLDLLFFLSLSFEGHDPVAVMMMYYSQPPFWVTLVLILAGCGAKGWWLEKRKK